MRTPVTRRPGTSAASAAFAAGTTAADTPARAAAATAGSTPRTGRTRPSRPSSPSSTASSNTCGGTTSCAARIAAAMHRSKLEPRLGRLAGDRLTVTRLVAGHCWPLFVIAARTRSRDSASDASGRPTRLYDGTPTPRSASTSTR